MSDPAYSAIVEWLLRPGTSRFEPDAFITALVGELTAVGLSLFRVSAWIPTKHPDLWGHQLVWDRDEGCRMLRRAHDVSDSEDYVGTPAEALHQSGAPTLRCHLEDASIPFAMLRTMARAGATDYLIIALEPDSDRGPWMAFMTDAPRGFTDPHAALLEAISPLVSLHVRLVAAHFAPRSLLEVYLGENASRRVLEGAFRRGTGRELTAALWFCDMRGFTAMSDQLSPRRVVRLLDGYFEHVTAAIEAHGGETLKFIGDAALAVFVVGDRGPRDPCRRALAAAEDALDALVAFSAEEELAISTGIALHLGEVMYGNIGGRARLDFTVIGASVNEVCRIESLCKPLGVPLLISADIARAVERDDLVCLGPHTLRGVGTAREVFTTAKRARLP